MFSVYNHFQFAMDLLCHNPSEAEEHLDLDNRLITSVYLWPRTMMGWLLGEGFWMLGTGGGQLNHFSLHAFRVFLTFFSFFLGE